MKIVVIGGSGLIGSKVVARLGDQGHEAVVAAPQTGVNTLTGEGLAEVLKGADVVVDVSNSPSFEAAAVMEFFTTSSRNVLAAEAEAGVGHHVALSVVGTSRLPDSGYFRAKVAQEELIAASPVPYSLVHATQFFEFAGAIADSATEGGTVRVPDALIQPIAADEVADAVTRAALGEPTRGVTEVAGPESFTFAELIERFFEARADEREVVSDPEARYFGARLEEKSLLPGEGAGIGRIRFADWLKAQTAK
ncbi:SDR family oxidoreductase [Spirillospora sp. NPDC029432]|uniref:SDR family oxidoreductase n=1 Tax=Spirillospora sp. NPDC029432 TaxID=3154599 RepID=UPI003452ECEF